MKMDYQQVQSIVQKMDKESKYLLTINLLNDLESETNDDTSKEWYRIALNRLQDRNPDNFTDALTALKQLS